MASGQQQGMLVAMIIFVILMVISMGLAVFGIKTAGERLVLLEAARKESAQNIELFNKTEQELNDLKDLVMAAATQGQDHATTEEVKTRYAADLKKYGDRLKVISTDAPTATYSQMLDAAISALEKQNTALEAANAAIAAADAAKKALEATAKGQVDQFEKQAMAAETEKAAIQAKLTAAEGQVRELQEKIQTMATDHGNAMTKLRAEMQKQIDDLTVENLRLKDVIKTKDDEIRRLKGVEFAAVYDGQITRVNPSARTVWINVGSYDNLKKHISFSVQPQGMPPGTNAPAKAKIEVTQLLGDHLAECRIVEDDLANPIVPGDNIYTSLWEPGQRTRFAFAGKIDLDDDGSDDMEQVRGLVARAGGQIDAEVVEGQIRGELSIETRYLVLGTLPADKAGIESYNILLQKAESLGIQRVPVAVFFDQIGYKKEPRRIQFGGGSAANNAMAFPVPDGGQRVSPGTVSDLFTKRRPPAATINSAY